MNWDVILTGLWQVINSVPAIMAMAALLGWLLTKLYSIRPAWEGLQGHDHVGHQARREVHPRRLAQ